MTNLTRPVTRRGKFTFMHYEKRIVVTLEPGDVIAMRLEGNRTVYRAPFSKVYVQLCRWFAASEKAAKGAP